MTIYATAPARLEVGMSEKVYKKIELVGCSGESVEKAVANAIAKASESLRGLSWFEVKEVRGAIHEGKPSEWQVTVLAGFKLD
jgi:flavin-binding protein dodecin